MQKLILIKHAPPEVEPSVSSEQWHLGDKGLAACGPLAGRLKPYGMGAIVTSIEPKAKQTGEELGRILGIAVRQEVDLEEHDRRDVPHMRTGEFISMMELFFRKPAELVLGDETADEALARIDTAISGIVEDETAEAVGVVTHGTVLALFLAQYNRDLKGFELWRKMGLPSFAVVNVPGFVMQEMAERV